MRTTYIKEISLRKLFIELGGLELLYQNLSGGDLDIIHEVLYDLQDLVYVIINYLINIREKKMNICLYRNY